MKSWIFITLPLVIITMTISVFELQIGLFVATGFLLAFTNTAKNVFGKAFLIQALITIALYLMYQYENAFLGNVAEAAGLPAVVLPVFLVIVNALTTAFSLQIGYSVKSLFK